MSDLVLSLDAGDLGLVLESLGWERLGDCLPDTTGAVSGGEAESGVGAPVVSRNNLI